jgi:hypothetical protein
MLTQLGRRYRQDEDGAVLVLALILIMILAVGLAAVLWFSDTSIRATEAIRTQGDQTYADTGAVDAAINGIRANSSMGVDPSIPGATPCTVTSTVGLNGVTPTVHCTGLPGSGGEVYNNPGNTPAWGLLALGTGGISLNVKRGNVVDVDGNVASNSTFASAGQGSTDITGDLTVKGTCSGTYTVSGNISCQTTTATADPAYPMGISSAPSTPGSYSPTGSCGAVRTFQPGLYTDPAVLNCPVDVFSPAANGTGYYYFNFPAGNSQWSIADQTVIGGTPTAGDQNCDPTQNGVEFIFGGQSSIQIGTNAIMHICANPNPTAQQIAIYGVSTTANGFTAETDGHGGTVTLLSSSGNSNGGDVVVSGTVYAPTAAASVNATNSSDQEFGRGLIASSISLTFSASVASNYLVAGTPPILVGTPGNRSVLFVGTVPGGLTITATVTYDDSRCPSLCGSRVTVTAWSVQR